MLYGTSQIYYICGTIYFKIYDAASEIKMFAAKRESKLHQYGNVVIIHLLDNTYLVWKLTRTETFKLM